jgi:hypothetical protein
VFFAVIVALRYDDEVEPLKRSCLKRRLYAPVSLIAIASVDETDQIMQRECSTPEEDDPRDISIKQSSQFDPLVTPEQRLLSEEVARLLGLGITAIL